MGTLLYLEALRKLKGEGAKKVLAIYSCGNAALGAAAVARAGGYELHAFVPEDVDPTVAAMLAERGTVVEKIPRSSTGAGDPCYLAFQKALNQNGWVPVCLRRQRQLVQHRGRRHPGLGDGDAAARVLGKDRQRGYSGGRRGPGALRRPSLRRGSSARVHQRFAAHPRLPARGRLSFRAGLFAGLGRNRPPQRTFLRSELRPRRRSCGAAAKNGGLRTRPPRSDSGGCRFYSAQL